MASKPTPRSYKQGWENQHKRFVSIATESKSTIVLIGDSIINGLYRYRKVWSEFFEPVNALNFGIREIEPNTYYGEYRMERHQ